MPSRDADDLTAEHLERLKRVMEEMQNRSPHPLDELRQSNPERYKRLSEPFEDADEMNQALSGFFKELGELREKYEIPDVHVAALANVKNGSLVEKRMSTMQYGDMTLRPFIVLSLYRQEHPMLQALMRGMTEDASEDATDAP